MDDNMNTSTKDFSKFNETGFGLNSVEGERPKMWKVPVVTCTEDTIAQEVAVKNISSKEND